MKSTTRPFSCVCSAMLHRIADGDTTSLSRLRQHFHDVDDAVGDRWQLLRVAETNAWKAVELLLLRKLIERRFHEGELNAWVQMTPRGKDIRDWLCGFFESHRSVEFPVEPKNFAVFAFQELRAARLAAELHAEPCDSVSNPEQIMERMAARLADRFPFLAQVIRHPQVDIVAMTWFILDFRMRMDAETRGAMPTSRTLPSNPGLEKLGRLFVTCPTTVEELIGDVYSQVEMTRRVKLAKVRRGIRDKNDDEELERQARTEVEAMLGRAVPLKAKTLAEAVAEAEKIKVSEDILVAQNSLWAWFNALPAEEQEMIGQFKNKQRFWSSVRFRLAHDDGKK